MTDEELPNKKTTDMQVTRKHPINVAELRRSLGQRRVVEIDHLFESFEVISSRTKKEPVTGSVIIESIERGVSVYGSITFAWEGDCRRCLELVQGQDEIDIDEIFQAPAPEDSDIIDLVDNTVDLVPLVLDAVALGVPLAPLCGPDCAGPDPERYPTKSSEQVEEERAEEKRRMAEQKEDPRWGALDQINFDN